MTEAVVARDGEAPAPSTLGRRFFLGLVAFSGFGLVVRVVYVLTVTRFSKGPISDEFYYVGQSAELVAGKGFVTPVVGGASALHPPLTVLVVTPATWLFGVPAGAVPQRITMALLGAVAVGVIGWLAAVVAGPRVGLIAAFLAAVYPNLWIPSGIVMSETLAVLITALILLATYRMIRHPSWVSAVLLGLGCGAAALTRSELAAFVVLLLIPAVLMTRRLSGRARLGLGALGIVVATLVVAPWIARNMATFRDPTYLSTGDGGLLLGANCDPTYSGPLIGYWSLPCSVAVAASKDPSVLSARQDHAARDYVGHHLGRLPVVIAARVGRIWDVFRPFQTARFDSFEGRPLNASWAGIWAFWVLAPLAVVGFVLLGRTGARRWPLLMPALLVTLLAAGAYGIIRFRAPAEVSIVVLAAVALDAGWRALATRRSGAAVAAPDQSSRIEASSAS
jgi:4-amino-4-deoxy-L-arabinose transferase-like glycosyltransferase